MHAYAHTHAHAHVHTHTHNLAGQPHKESVESATNFGGNYGSLLVLFFIFHADMS